MEKVTTCPEDYPGGPGPGVLQQGAGSLSVSQRCDVGFLTAGQTYRQRLHRVVQQLV